MYIIQEWAKYRPWRRHLIIMLMAFYNNLKTFVWSFFELLRCEISHSFTWIYINGLFQYFFRIWMKCDKIKNSYVSYHIVWHHYDVSHMLMWRYCDCRSETGKCNLFYINKKRKNVHKIVRYNWDIIMTNANKTSSVISKFVIGSRNIKLLFCGRRYPRECDIT